MIIKLKTKQVHIKYEAKIKQSASILTSSHYQVQWQVRTELANYCMLHGSSSQNDVMYEVLMDSNFLWNGKFPESFDFSTIHLSIHLMHVCVRFCMSVTTPSKLRLIFRSALLMDVSVLSLTLCALYPEVTCSLKTTGSMLDLTKCKKANPTSHTADPPGAQLSTCWMCQNLSSPACYLLDVS